MTKLLSNVVTDEGDIETERLAVALNSTKGELARFTGLSRDAVSKRSRSASRPTQQRLRDTVEIINRVADWSGGTGRAFARFRSQPLPSFGARERG